MKKAEGALTKIQAVSGPTQTIVLLKLDLSSLQSVRDFASKVKEHTDKIHLLINNAGGKLLHSKGEPRPTSKAGVYHLCALFT